MKLYIIKADDRDAVIVILARSGYTVRQGKDKQTGKTSAVSFVEVISGPGISKSSAE